MSTPEFDQRATEGTPEGISIRGRLWTEAAQLTKSGARFSGGPLAGLVPAAVAWSMCAVSLALTALGLLMLALSWEHPGVPVFEQCVEEIVIAIGFSTVGAVIAPRFPSHNYIGWLFCSIGLVAGVLLFCGEYAAYSLLARPGSLPGGEPAAWIVGWLWVPHVGLFALLGLLFPDGRPPTPRWRPFAWTVVVAMLFGAVADAFSPGPVRGLGAIRNPFSIEGVPGVSGLIEVIMFSLTLAAAASLLARLRGACDVKRQQIKWFAYAATVAALGALISWVVADAVDAWWLHWEVGFVGTVVGLAGLPVALGIAVLRYRLHEIDLIINLTFVYGILTAVFAGIFEVTVVALQHVLLVFAHQEESQLAYFGTALVMAALFEPLKHRINAFVDRLFFRQNDEGGKLLESQAN